jgi:dinuclear metal center YbgI/SA1388 family protein
MIKRDQLTHFLNNYFGADLIAKARQKDEHMPDGLQWSGQDEIKKIVLGVSANLDFFKEAVKAEADVVLTHHGLPVDTPFNLFSQSLQKRIKFLAAHQLSLYAYHFILDSHPQIGHNALILKKLGAKKTLPLMDEWGWVGQFSQAQSVDQLAKKCAALFSHDVFMVKAEKKKVKTIGVVSGRGVPFLEKKLELIEKGVELYISGEISEWNPAEFKEMGITYFACGHYATEVFGVQELGEVIKKEFKNKLEVEFLDMPNSL